MIKTMKFTRENLNTHLNSFSYTRADYGKYIHTTRDERKGNVGDIFKIDDVGYFVLISCVEYLEDNIPYYFEGFSSRKELVDELRRIYGNEPRKSWWMHSLMKLNQDMTEQMDVCFSQE